MTRDQRLECEPSSCTYAVFETSTNQLVGETRHEGIIRSLANTDESIDGERFMRNTYSSSDENDDFPNRLSEVEFEFDFFAVRSQCFSERRESLVET